MVKIFVLLTHEDQSSFRAGEPPEHHFEREFETRTEMRSYISGIEAVSNLREHDILEDDGLLIVVSLDGHKKSLRFNSIAEKKAYIQGLADGDGFVSPKIHRNGSPEYAALAKLVSSTQSASGQPAEETNRIE